MFLFNGFVGRSIPAMFAKVPDARMPLSIVFYDLYFTQIWYFAFSRESVRFFRNGSELS